MSILIKGMDMPENCGRCHLWEAANFGAHCLATEEPIVFSYDARSSNCPLIEISSADVAPVVHGRWIFHDDKPLGFSTECSVCHAEGMLDGYYCPNCGAKMDLLN